MRYLLALILCASCTFGQKLTTPQGIAALTKIATPAKDCISTGPTNTFAIAFAGDSIMNGAYYPEFYRPSSYAYGMACKYTNVAVNGARLSDVLSVQIPIIKSLGITNVWLHAGVNDLLNWSYWSNVKPYFDQIRTNVSGRLYVSQILPFDSQYMDLYEPRRSDIYTNLIAWCVASNAIMVSNYTSFTAANGTNLNTVYNYGDGIHLTVDGAKLYGSFISNILSPVFCFTNATPNTEKFIVQMDQTTDSYGPVAQNCSQGWLTQGLTNEKNVSITITNVELILGWQYADPHSYIRFSSDNSCSGGTQYGSLSITNVLPTSAMGYATNQYTFQNNPVIPANTKFYMSIYSDTLCYLHVKNSTNSGSYKGMEFNISKNGEATNQLGGDAYFLIRMQ